MSGEVREVIPIRASTEEVRQCILSARRILQYYPMGNGSGDIEPGRSFYCKGRLGVSLFEIVRSDPDHIVLEVHNATACDAPYTAERLKQAAFFSMLEDWHLEDDAGNTKLTRLWRDFEQHRLKMIPVKLLVQLTAKLESRAIKKHWATRS
ncbi:MAG: hypothetical protein JRD92_18750 [Deltaproteobacteria bacterium]|nr:hypothetical protein [Deltaproteobacteria bacterium]